MTFIFIKMMSHASYCKWPVFFCILCSQERCHSSSFCILVHLGLISQPQSLQDQEKEKNDQKCKKQILQLAYISIFSQRLFSGIFSFGSAAREVKRENDGGWGKGEIKKPPSFIPLRLLKRWRFFSLGSSATTRQRQRKLHPKVGFALFQISLLLFKLFQRQVFYPSLTLLTFY